jgi:methylated-DNA-[protein]-cysteine S-methyltransferase
MDDTILGDIVETPIGPMTLLVRGDKLIGLEFGDQDWRIGRDLKRRFGGDAPKVEWVSNPLGLSDRVAAYYTGDFAAVDGIDTDGGGTPFQERVWAELKRIPKGTVISYLDLACRLGQPTATRAVGLANGRNPISIVVPCHRVIGADGSLTGYGGGIERKRWLLEHEGVPLRDGRLDSQSDLFSAQLTAHAGAH